MVTNRAKHPDLRSLYPFPPGQVKDMRVNATSYEEKTATVQWTAVGDFEEQETGEAAFNKMSPDLTSNRLFYHLLISNVNESLIFTYRE